MQAFSSRPNGWGGGWLLGLRDLRRGSGRGWGINYGRGKQVKDTLARAQGRGYRGEEEREMQTQSLSDKWVGCQWKNTQK